MNMKHRAMVYHRCGAGLALCSQPGHRRSSVPAHTSWLCSCILRVGGTARLYMPALVHVGHIIRQSAWHTPCKLNSKGCAMQAGSIALRGSRHSPHTTKGGFAVSPLGVCGVIRGPGYLVDYIGTGSSKPPLYLFGKLIANQTAVTPGAAHRMPADCLRSLPSRSGHRTDDRSRKKSCVTCQLCDY